SLAAEILGRLPAASRDMLLRTAFLPRLTAGMAEDLSGNPRAGRLLEDLYRSSFFIARKGTADVVYEYHGLLRGFLLARGRSNLPADEQQRLAHDAARIAEARKESEQAFQLYRQAGDTDAAHRLAVKQAPVLLAQGRGRTLETWIEALPGGAAAHPERLFWQGLCHLGGRAAPAGPVGSAGGAPRALGPPGPRREPP